MKKFNVLLFTAGLLLSFLSGFTFSATGQDFGRWFEPRSLRIDFALSGNSDGQSAALLQLRDEPVYAGPRRNMVDGTGLGGYFANIYDRQTGQLIFSRGFNTLFEEWLTTEEASEVSRSYTNSISVPYPKQPVEVEIIVRDRETLDFESLLRFEIDPAGIFIDRGELRSQEVRDLHISGDPWEKVDLVFLAEGYTAPRQDKFFADAARFTELLFDTPPFDAHRDDFNVRAVGLVSDEPGTDISGEGIFRNTALGSGFYTFGLDRYLTTPDIKSIRDALWNIPCDAVFILVDTDLYGGGGIYNFYAIGTADNERTHSVFVHEFGHSFAGLADEYFTKDVAYTDFYSLGSEPWEPNITTLVDFGSKWKDLLDPSVPVPTPSGDKYGTGLGVFEGGGYVSEGVYRPMDHCMMRDYAPFCPVCSRAIVRMIDFYCDRNY